MRRKPRILIYTGLLLAVVVADAAAQQVDQIGQKTGRFVSGDWVYKHTVGARGRTGLLRYKTSPVIPGGMFDYVTTPWGKMYWWGTGTEDKALAGWILQAPPDGRVGRQIQPAARTAGSDKIDLDRSGQYMSGYWRFELEVKTLQPGSSSRTGKLLLADRPIGGAELSDYVKTPWGVMYWWGEKPDAAGLAGWLPKMPAGLPGRLIRTAVPTGQSNAQPGQNLPVGQAQPLDLTQPGGYQSGKWKYLYTIWSKGQASEGSMGQLFHDQKAVQAVEIGDAVQTPWGSMYYWGAMQAGSLAGQHGWAPTRPEKLSGRQIDPTSAGIAQVDLTIPGTYKVGKWTYIYLVWNAEGDLAGSTGRLVEGDRQIEGIRTGQKVVTPWGTMWWYGRLADVRGLSGWIPVRPRARDLQEVDSLEGQE
ncbi:MAG: hypothetical protein ACLFUJ_12475 [Phycisphaerae bacterium]